MKWTSVEKRPGYSCRVLMRMKEKSILGGNHRVTGYYERLRDTFVPDSRDYKRMTITHYVVLDDEKILGVYNKERSNKSMGKGIIRNVDLSNDFVVSDENHNINVFGDKVRIKYFSDDLTMVFVLRNKTTVGILYFKELEDRRKEPKEKEE